MSSPIITDESLSPSGVDIRILPSRRAAEPATWSRRKKALVMTGLALGLWALLLGTLFVLL
jgi:hypothetical protein